MRNIKFIVAMVTFFVSSTFAVYAQQGRQEAPAVTPDTKQEPKQEVKEAGTDQAIKGRYVATVGPDGVQHVDILGGQYYFDPNHIVVKVNVPVEFKVKKEKGYVPHDIVVKAPEAGIDFKVELSDKDVKIVQFTPTKTGKYRMICDKQLLFLTSHKERGMEGVIEVVQ